MQQHYRTDWQERVSKGWRTELSANEYNVVGTLKFNNGRAIDSTLARNILKAYWHKLDRTFFGHAADKGIGIERWIFSEFGSTGDNLHFHFKAKAPIEPYYFCCIANVMWQKFHRRTASGIYNWITPTVLQANSSGYIVKDTRKFTYDMSGLEASLKNTTNINPMTYRNAAQAQRILNKVSLEEITQAQQIVDWQIEETIRRIHLRQRRAEAQGAR
jgi:hypothetical protein